MIDQGKKTYILGMFPYPSGEGLHVGHGRIFTAVDVMARYFRAKSNDGRTHRSAPTVLSPMGWDAFGLPAENAAIKAKKIPQEMVPKNYANFKRQMQNLDLSFDWERELATTDPNYYGITQWIFLQLYNKGLVYREKVAINWCPKCLTGLANEEVLADGTHERCGTLTGKKLLPQWVMRITSYAERLLNDLDKEKLDWPRGILEMQRNWIGKKEGHRVEFQIMGNELRETKLEVFTTRIDTINGVTFIAISPELAKKWIENEWDASSEVRNYVDEALKKSEQSRLVEVKEKTGVATGLMAVNPENQSLVPIWVADYVLLNVGTGAVMGVPIYDERDHAFAEKFGLEIRETKLMDKVPNFAQKETSYHLRDWVFSRQRYWGEPIPLVYCEKCGDENGVVPLTEKDLPLTLPYLESYEPTDTGESPLSRVAEWVNCKCPKCGGLAQRETDTMPNWAGSCWYFLAFPWWNSTSARQKSTGEVLKEYKKKSKTPMSDFWKEYAKPEIDKWLPVDWYLGGAEHAVLHLLYARFWVKVLQDLGLVDFPEPFLRLRSVGMVLASDGRKMSKSLGNVINPDDMVAQFGADEMRLYEMFMGPWDQAISWDTRALVGQKRFLERVKGLYNDKSKIANDKSQTSPKLLNQLVQLVKKVETGIVEQKFNTAIAGFMEMVNLWRTPNLVMSKEHAKYFVQLLSPFAPQIANSLWQTANGNGKVEDAGWPDVSSIQLTDDVMITIAVQVNGKLRGTIMVNGQWAMDEDKVTEMAKNDPKVKKWVTGEVKKVIFVPGRLVNIVI